MSGAAMIPLSRADARAELPPARSIDDQRLLRRELFIFLAIVFGTSALLAAFAGSRGGLSALPMLPVAMLFPWLAAFTAGRLVRGRAAPPLGFRVGRLGYWLLAPLAYLLLWCTVFAVSYVVHPSAYADAARVVTNIGRLHNVPTVGGPATRLSIAYALTIFVGPLLNLPIFLGEEVGWRGFMTPRLVTLFGRRGLIVGGCVWALWHTPFILLGLNYPDHPLLGLVVWIPLCTALGIMLQTVYARSGSILPPALCHGLTNQFAMLTLSVFAIERRFVDVVDGPAGLVALLVVAIPAVLCYRSFPVAHQPDA